jgi:hypothetical protein
MSLKYFKSKFVCILLGFVFLLQSLVIYKKTLVSIAEATATNHKVLIIKTDDTKLKLKKIELIEGMYYGITDDNGKIVKVPLTESNIKTIRVLDKTASTWGTIGIVAGSLLIIFGIIASSEVQSIDIVY